MLRDLRDLEPLLGQYDPGLGFIGPVLSLPSSGCCYVYIAANGSKVYEAVSLGFFEDEADAEIQRASIIAILKSRFKEMLTFGSHYEMARAVHTRWPNDETAKVLASATPATKPELVATAQDDSKDDNSPAHVIPSDYGQQLVDDVARKLVVSGSADRPATLKHEHFGLVQDEIASAILSAFQRTDHPPSITSLTAPFRADNRPATPQQGYSGHSDEDIAAVSRALRPSYQSQSAPKLPAAMTTPLSDDFVDDVARKLVVSGSADRPATLKHEHFGLVQDEIASAILSAFQRTDHPPSITSLTAPFRADNRPATPQQGYSGHSDEDIAAVSRVLRPSYQSQSAPKLPAAMTTPLSDDRVVREQRGNFEFDQNNVAAISRAIKPTNRLQSVLWRAARNLASTAILICAVGGASALLTWAMVLSSAPRMAHEVGPTTAPQPVAATVPSTVPTQQTASIKPAQIEAAPDEATASLPSPQGAGALGAQHAEANEPTQLVEPAPAAMAPPPPTPQRSGASNQVEAVPASSPEQHAEANEPTQLAEPAPAAMTPPPPTPQRSGASNQVEAVPASSPEQHAEANEPTQLAEPPHSVASAQAGAASVSGPQPTPAQGSITALRLDSQEITTLMDGGSAYFKRGDFASARLLFRRAAEAGSANAALMLGSTFDPLIIRQFGVIGIEPDVARASQWYEKAEELGSDAASQRLANLKNQ